MSSIKLRLEKKHLRKRSIRAKQYVSDTAKFSKKTKLRLRANAPEKVNKKSLIKKEKRKPKHAPLVIINQSSVIYMIFSRIE